MSDQFYTELQGDATELFEEFSQGTIYLVRRAVNAADTDRPWDVAVTEPTRVLLSGTVRSVERKYVDGTRVKGTEDQVKFAVPADVVPAVTDVIEIDGVEKVTVDFHAIPAAGVPVAYVFIVRGH